MTTLDRDLGSALAELGSFATDEWSEGTLTDIVRRHEQLVSLISWAADLRDDLAETIAERMEEDQLALTGIGQVVRKPRFSTTWIDDESKDRMHSDALNAIVRRVATDPATGEIHAPLNNAVREAWRLLSESFSFLADPKSAFRKTLGLNPDEYRARRRTGFTIKVEGDPQ